MKKTKKNYYTILCCRYCQSKNLTSYMNLGSQPLADSFLRKKDIPTEKNYPLNVMLCRTCGLSQLSIVVDPTYLFGEYAYLTSSSNALIKHYKTLTEYISQRFNLNKSDVVVDVGCNDGTLLLGYEENLTRIGIEPSSVAKLANKNGNLKILNEFLSLKIASQIVREFGTAKIITATNVFAHIDKIDEFLNAINVLLDEKGIFVIEAPYVIDMIERNYFDTIYHEHLSYLGLTPIVELLRKFNLQVMDVERVEVGASGPALRIFIGKKNAYSSSSSVKKLLTYENKWGIKRISRYRSFQKTIQKIKKETVDEISKIVKINGKIGGYGAPAKGNTLLNYFEIDSKMIQTIADTNPLKQGLLTPGTHIPIVSEEKFLKNMPKYALLLSWNYLDFFLEKSQFVKNGGKFIVPLPKLRVLP